MCESPWSTAESEGRCTVCITGEGEPGQAVSTLQPRLPHSSPLLTSHPLLFIASFHLPHTRKTSTIASLHPPSPPSMSDGGYRRCRQGTPASTSTRLSGRCG